MVGILEFQQQILPPGSPVTVWGYGGQAKDAVIGKRLGYIKLPCKVNAPTAL